MKIVFVNKSDRVGGAAVACRRLHTAIVKSGTDSKLLVQEKTDDDPTVIAVGSGFWKKKKDFLLFVIERLYFLFYEASKEIRYAFSPAVAGENIHKNTLIKNADIVHIHWFNQGYLSLKNLKALLIQQKKMQILKGANITFVTSSHWLKREADKSMLLKDFRVLSIPIPIDANVFYTADKYSIRKKLSLPKNKKLILFAAANISDKRKGLDYLLQALKLIEDNNLNFADIEILTFGKFDAAAFYNLSFKVYNLGVISEAEKIAEVYNAADLFAIPSLEDNLPNTIIESLACGTPVLAFNSGGMPEMVDHKINGYVAEYKSVDDLKNGIEFIINHPDAELLGKNAVEKAQQAYSEKGVAEKYKKVYKEILNQQV
ncbi:MAG: hypothetical protein B6I20_13220 [Bacteroidetes bacterium 4572_117]|nr:MAG: hypothetical protein B6I20_13220 [Bacteroidetes bacterium 4572_117]